jgi:hypothetical protein
MWSVNTIVVAVLAVVAEVAAGRIITTIMWSVNTIVVVAVVAVVAAGRIITTIMWSVNRVIVVAAGRIRDIDLEVDSFIMRSDDDNRLAQNQ